MSALGSRPKVHPRPPFRVIQTPVFGFQSNTLGFFISQLQKLNKSSQRSLFLWNGASTPIHFGGYDIKQLKSGLRVSTDHVAHWLSIRELQYI